MVQVIMNAKDIASAYSTEVLSSKDGGMLTQDDFTSMTDGHQPVALIKVDDEGSLSDLMGQAIGALEQHVADPISGIILSIAYREEEEIEFGEMGPFMELVGTLAKGEIELTWGMQAKGGLKNKRNVSVYVFK